MKLIQNLFASSTAQHLVFACGCVAVLSGGLGTKLVLDRIDAMQDEFEREMKLPSQEYMRFVFQRTKHLTAGQPAKAAPVQETVKQPVLP